MGYCRLFAEPLSRALIGPEPRTVMILGVAFLASKISGVRKGLADGRDPGQDRAGSVQSSQKWIKS